MIHTETFAQDINNASFLPLWNSTYYRAVALLLGGARKEILLSTFKMEIPRTSKHYALKQIISPLLGKQEHPRDIKILLQHSPDTPGEPRINVFTANYLQGKGIPVRHLKTKRVIHAKMFIIDQRYLIFGSHNLSSTSLQRNLELSFLIKEPSLVKDAREHFLHYWEEAIDFPHPPPFNPPNKEVI